MPTEENGVCFFASQDAILLTLRNSVAMDICKEKRLSNKTWVDVALSHTISGADHAQSCHGLERRLKSLCPSAESVYRKTKGRAKRRFLRKVRTLIFPLEPLPAEAPRDMATESMSKALAGTKEENRKLKESVQQLESVVRDQQVQCCAQERKISILMQLLHYKA